MYRIIVLFSSGYTPTISLTSQQIDGFTDYQAATREAEALKEEIERTGQVYVQYKVVGVC